MRRKAIVLLIVSLFLGFRVYAIEPNADGSYPEKTFTAFKSKMTGELPESTFDFLTLTTAEGKSITSSSTLITTSESSRNTETTLFIWTASGTMAGAATISFEFSPLTLKSGQTVLATIPYTVKITHKTSTVDGIQVAVNRDASSASPQRCSFSSYRFNYSDTVKTGTGSAGSLSENLSVSADVDGSSSAVLRMQYDMSSATVTKDAAGNIVKSNGTAISYPYDVTDLWVRTGECVITQKITADGKSLSGSAFSAGWYSAQVTVSVTSDT